ncbi:MAG: hypothetical protein GQ554_09040 [Deltaproteobacteria bacterium]|nr:hypothetical protein [Deltaproteobacteria bacterium]
MAIIKCPVTGIHKLHFFRIFLETVNRECAMMDNCTRQANPYVLVPTTALKKIAITYKKEDKEQEVAISSFLFGTFGIRH